jgi:type II secretory pathway pseudopilin PulG
MVEMVVAMLIFSILVTGIAAMNSTSLNIVRNDRNRSVAAALASQEMDTVRSTTFTELPAGQITTVQDVDGVPYTIVRESQWVSSTANAGACDAPAGSKPAFLRVNVSVSWPVMAGVRPVEADTIVTPPVGTYDSSSGNIAVSVVNRDGAPASGITIGLTGPGGESQVTTEDGCAFFAFLPAGSYTVTATSTGYVSDQGIASPQQPASVLVGATTSILYLYDQAATLNLTLSGKVLGSTAPSGVPMMLANSHILPSGTKLFPGSGSPRTIANLFPWLDGYEAWAGGCTDADPASYPGGTRAIAISTTPGATTTATVLMPEIRVVVTHDPGTGTPVPVPGQAVQATHAADAGCTGGASYAVGTTDAAGQLTFALPYGTWQVKVGAVVVGTVALAPTDPDGPYEVEVTQ